MSDLAKWRVHGRVHTLRTEFAEWDLSKEEWQPPGHFMLVRFLPDGRIGESESHNPDRSISRCSYLYDGSGRLTEMKFRIDAGPISKTVYGYDDSGRLVRVVSVEQDGAERESETYRYGPDGKKTKVYFVPKLEANTGFGYSIEDMEESYPTTGATTAVTVYDDGGRPDELLLYNPEHRLLGRVIFKRDTAGRLLSAEMHSGGPYLFPKIDNVPPEAMAAIAKLFAPNNVMSRTTYTYDEKGRLLERRARIGELGEQRTTYRYDDHDNRIEQTMEDASREMQIDEEGNFQPVKEVSNKQHARMEYKYDVQGNWTECVVWGRMEPNPNFERSNTERRAITYYGN